MNDRIYLVRIEGKINPYLVTVRGNMDFEQEDFDAAISEFVEKQAGTHVSYTYENISNYKQVTI